jgi:general secretion pathway protein H
MAIAGLVLAAAVPASVRFYESMQARQAVRDTVALLASARERALSSGLAQDVMVRPAARRIWSGDRERVLPDSLRVTVHGAAELNHADTGVIRFYPEGGASGGGIDLQRRDGSGTAVNVDWLVGRVSQEPLRRE